MPSTQLVQGQGSAAPKELLAKVAFGFASTALFGWALVAVDIFLPSGSGRGSEAAGMSRAIGYFIWSVLLCGLALIGLVISFVAIAKNSKSKWARLALVMNILVPILVFVGYAWL
jgi:hypothetical protein